MSCYVGSTSSESGTNISLLKSIHCWDSSTQTVSLTEVEGWAAEYSWMSIYFSGDVSSSGNAKLCAVTGLIPMSDFIAACNATYPTEIYLPGPGLRTGSSYPLYTVRIIKDTSSTAYINEQNSYSSSVGLRYLTLYGMK